jgi:large subunit ribosomal protein L31
MKKGIHPDYKVVNVTLADGSTTVIRSTLQTDEYRSDVDRTNHPFFTGRRQYVDTAGRVEKFNRRYAKPSAGTDDSTGESA